MKKNLIILLKTILVFLLVLAIAVAVTYINKVLYVCFPIAFWAWSAIAFVALFVLIFLLVKKTSK